MQNTSQVAYRIDCVCLQTVTISAWPSILQKKIKIALYFAQLQAKKNMQHQTKQAQFSI